MKEGQRGRRRGRGGDEARERRSLGAEVEAKKPDFGRGGRLALLAVATAAKDALNAKLPRHPPKGDQEKAQALEFGAGFYQQATGEAERTLPL